MKKTKPFLVFVMTIALMLSNIGITNVLADEPVSVTSYSQSSKPSNYGTSFEIYLTLKGEDDTVINAVDFDNTSNFTKVGQGVSAPQDLGNGYYQVTLSLKYLGYKEQSLPISITYTDKNSNTRTYRYVYTVELTEKTTEQSPTVVQPKIAVDGTLSAITAQAGSTIRVEVPVKATVYDVISPEFLLNMEDNPDFTISSNGNLNTINYIYQNNKATINFELKISESTKSGDYKFYLSAQTKDNMSSICTVSVSTPIIIKVEGKEGPSVTINSTKYPEDLAKGTKFDLVLGLKNIGDLTAKSVKLSLSGFGECFIPRYSADKFSIVDINAGSQKTLSVPLEVLKTAEAGTKILTAKISYKNASGETVEETSNIYINIPSVGIFTPSLELVKTNYPTNLVPEQSFNLEMTFENYGDAAATNNYFMVEGFSTDSFVPNFNSGKIYMEDVLIGSKKTVKIPLKVTKTATLGTKTLIVKGYYMDDNGVEYTTSNTIYFDIVVDEKTSAKPELIVSAVSQSPQSPYAGERMSVSFYLENKTSEDIKELKLATTNLSNANFSPVSSDPYQYIKEIKAGKKVRVNIPLKVSENVIPGLNELAIQMDYSDTKGTEYNQAAKIYILDVQNETQSGGLVSKPKIIINNFSTDVEELRAGKTFVFTFDAFNTHSNIDAENIKVTISSADNVFSITKGSNSFYINKIAPQETVTSFIELRVKSDSITKAYPLEILFEYEYTGSKESAGSKDPVAAKETVEVKEIINLQVMENARPVVNGIGVGMYEPATVNMPTALSFEFYNMGLSVLRNVIAKVEGDFVSSSSMLYIGNVEAGMSGIQEMEVTPLIEGLAYGTLIISYEDSNGDTVEFSTPFESTIQGQMNFDPGVVDPGFYEQPVAKKEIVKLPIFIFIQIVLFIVGTIIARIVTLKLYKRKLRKKEEEI